ncbi:MAG: hypothetical protein IJZ47_00570 [Oscillospiraceae bacterium]|nr:hypothetical protein [Oscillospiraceae bacterium]
MKRSSAFLLAFVLLTGCADASESIGTEQTAEPTIETVQTAESTSAPQTSLSAEDTTESIRETKIDAKKVEIQQVHEFCEEDIIAQLGYDAPMNSYYTEEDRQAAIEYTDAMPDSALKQQYITQNYNTIMLQTVYLGNDTADWIGCANYDLCYYEGISNAYHGRVFYIKDGMVSEMLFEGDPAALKVYDGEVFISRAHDGLYRLDTVTMELQLISESISSVDAINDKYIVFTNFSDNVTEIYIRDSGSVLSTDIYQSRFDGTMIRLMDDILLYYIDNEGVYELSLPDGTVTKSDRYGLIHIRDESIEANSKYKISAASTNAYPEQYISITHNDTGLIETLYYKDFSEELYHQQANNTKDIMLNGDILYIPFRTGTDADGLYAAYDIATGEAVYFNAGSFNGMDISNGKLTAYILDATDPSGPLRKRVGINMILPE